MRRLCRSFAVACCLAAALYQPAATQSTPVSAAALRDIRIYIRFESGTGYDNNDARKDDFRHAAEMGMRMWESIFPTMRVYFVSSQSAANLTFNVGNYAGIVKNDCGTGGGAPGGTWSGCSFYPDLNGNIAGGNIWFNTRSSTDAPYRHGSYDLFSRELLYSSYRPATDPPEDYGTAGLANGAGWIDGRFASQLDGTDGSHIVFHEFGHSVGLGHIADDVLKFYGIPYPPERHTANHA